MTEVQRREISMRAKLSNIDVTKEVKFELSTGGWVEF